MKKTYLLLAALLTTSLSFGQNNQQLQPAQSVISPNQTTVQEQSTRPNPQSISTSPLVNTEVHSGQHSCAAHDLNEQHYASRGILNEFNQSYQQTASNAANLTFPETPNPNEISVIFHVVHNPSNPAENVTNAQIMAVFQELQDDYLLLNADAANARTGLGFTPANTTINFCLATQDPMGAPLTEVGVVRVSTTEDYYDHDGGEENKMKAAATGGSEIWDRNKYLNVWICNITNGLNYGTAGYAYRPTPVFLPSANIDGIVIDYNIGMGSNVLTHEVGHYLGLDHTWGGSGGCGNDDSFTDTPDTDGPADQNAAFNCGMPSFQTCGVEVQYENYMDYATGCTVMFTQEQSNYMLSILQGIRGSLLLSPGCDPTNTPPNSAFTSMPTPGFPTIIPVNGSVSLLDQSTNVPTGWTWTVSGTQGVDWNWINGSNATTQDPDVEFYTVGLYDVTLTASNGWGTDATPASETGYIQVAPAATGIGCDTLRNWDPSSGISSVTWSAPSSGHVYGNAFLGGENVLETAELFTAPATTDVKGVEFFPVIVSDAGGSITINVWADNAGEPAAVPLTTETVTLASLDDTTWNHVDFTTPAVGVTGNFWVGFTLSYNSTDTLAMFGQIVGAAQDRVSLNRTTPGWNSIATITGNAAGLVGVVDVLTSTGSAPTMNFTATIDEVCVGGDIIVNGSGSTNNSDYRWYVTDDPWTTTEETSSSAGNTFNFPYAPGAYNIYLFGSGSCIDDGVFMPVTLNAAVAATVTPTATTCGNNNGSIDVTGASGGDGTYFYSLDGVNYQAGSSFTGLAPGDYDVYIATFGDNCEAMYTVTVLGSTPPTASASAAASVCPGGSTTVTATGGGTYQWFDGANAIGTGATISVTPTATTLYDCVVTVGGCSTNTQATVVVNALPPAPTVSAAGSTTICSGSSVDLTSSYPTNNVWSTTETSSTITVSTAGPVTVTYTDANGCSSTSLATTIVVNNAPAISAGTITNPSSCGTSTGSIQVAGSGTGDVTWTGTASGSAIGVTLPHTISGLAAGSYNITITDGNGCTSNILAQGLNDPNPPTTPVITPSGAVTFCDGGSVDLTSSYGSDNSWSTSETTSTITVTTTQTISVTYTDGSGCSSTSAPIVITVNALPSAPTVTAGGALTFCDGGSVDLTSSQGTGNTWSSGGSGQTETITQTGSYTVTYTDGNGCSATSAATDVTVNPLPTVTLAALSDVCDYFAPFALAGGTPAGGTYSGTGVNGANFEPGTAGLGTHAITYTYTDGNGCTNTDQQDILVDPCLSLEEQDNLGLSIFPNPTTNELNIVLSGDFDFNIVDARGRTITSGSGSQVVIVNTADFESGVYFVTINNEKDTVVTRVVKQ